MKISRPMGVGFLIVLVLAALFVGVSVMINQWQPSEKEHDVATELLARAKRVHSLGEGQSLFFNMSRDTVWINAYGILDEKAQQAIEGELKRAAKERRFEGSIYLAFFPRRQVTKNGGAAGSPESKAQKSDPLKTIQIQ
jgi:hypothetical protein